MTGRDDRAQRRVGWRGIGYLAAVGMLMGAAEWADGAHSEWAGPFMVLAAVALGLGIVPAYNYLTWYAREGRRRHR